MDQGLLGALAGLDAWVGCSVPPLVQGTLRGEVEVTISRFCWSAGRDRGNDVGIRFSWWGYDSREFDTVFHPIVCSASGVPYDQASAAGGGKNHVNSCAMFPVKASPQHLLAYIRDCATLGFDIYHAGEFVGKARFDISQDHNDSVDDDDEIVVEGVIPATESESEGVIGLVDLSVHIRFGQHYSKLLKLISTEEQTRHNPPLRLGEKPSGFEQECALVGETSFELNELQANSDIGDALPVDPRPQAATLYTPIVESSETTNLNIENAGTPSSAGRKTVAAERALNILKTLRKQDARKRNQSGVPNKRTPKNSPKHAPLPSVLMEKGDRVKIQDDKMQSVLLRALRLRDEIDSALRGKENTQLLTDSRIYEEQSVVDTTGWQVDLGYPVPNVDRTLDPMVAAIQPVLSGVAQCVQSVETASIVVKELELQVDDCAVVGSNWMFEASLVVPIEWPPESFERSFTRTPVLRGPVPRKDPTKGLKQNQKQRPAKPPHRIRTMIGQASTFPVNLDQNQVKRWLNGNLEICISRIDGDSELAVARGVVALRQLLLSTSLYLSTAIPLYAFLKTQSIATILSPSLGESI
eukprot:CAMPEP_0203751844 /NCGR_PEP_ID=MMETSP0098-20131031/5843_1 /ASSEMBLY_ACC=CAM_ASM_000208 /TAXON_ID=96639 /ORGANISM=" , Strain NY0313808BC1" /LENGTH=582 /DNA_ID=CAMNT_0050641743 /DNA_START=40 /DNA_END=1785 /DNA_ORIENTATION=+